MSTTLSQLQNNRARIVTTLHEVAALATTQARALVREIEDPLLNISEFPSLRGGISKRAKSVQEAIHEHLATHSSRHPLFEDADFLTFANRMSLTAARVLGFDGDTLKLQPIKAQGLVDYLTAHYQLLVEERLPPSSNTQIHRYSLWRIGEILRESNEIFSSDPTTTRLARTAAQLVLKRTYNSVREAKSAYDQALADSQQIFGSNEETRSVIRTAALAVFCNRYSSMEEARTSYLTALRDAESEFGQTEELRELTRTAANFIFSRKYRSMSEAKAAYEKALAESELAFGADPELADITRTAAGLVFVRKYPSIDDVKKNYEELLAESVATFGADPLTKELVRTAAYVLLDRRYPSIAEAKSAYEAIYADATQAFGDSPDTNEFIRTAAYLVFKKRYASIAEAKRAFDDGLTVETQRNQGAADGLIHAVVQAKRRFEGRRALPDLTP